MNFNILKILKGVNNFIYQNVFKYKHGVKWILAILVGIIIIILYEFDVFERLELLTLDYRFILRHPKPKPSNIVFIDMAEDSIETIGRWPWPRRWHATLIKALSDYHPRAIALDVIFSEPQDELDDLALEEAIKQSGQVYLPLSYTLEKEDMRYLYEGKGVVSVLGSLSNFKKHVKGTGHINAIPDTDGILRRVPAIIGYGDTKTYQFGLKIGFDMLGLKDRDIIFYPQHHQILLKLAGEKVMKIPLDRDNQLIVNWQGKWGKEFRHFSYIDVIRSYAAIKDGKPSLIDLNEFRDKICIIGLTASGLIDIKPIPIETTYPAVGINAMAVNSITTNDFIYEVPKKYNMLLILLFSMLITLCLSNLRLLGGMLLAITGIIIYAIFSVVIFSLFNIALATFYPILAIAISYSLTSMYTQILQSIERTRLFKQATRDGLTYLYNVRHFNLLLEAEFKNVSIYKFRRLSLVMGDIDNFKHLNDTYGHPAGDTILREVAKIMQSRCRQIDVVARYGGEEFIIMLTGAGEKDAFDIAEKIRSAVEAKKFKFKNDTYNPTISIGVAEFSNEKDKDELIEKVDKALYKAKHEGKNKVCVYSAVGA